MSEAAGGAVWGSGPAVVTGMLDAGGCDGGDPLGTAGAGALRAGAAAAGGTGDFALAGCFGGRTGATLAVVGGGGPTAGLGGCCAAPFWAVTPLPSAFMMLLSSAPLRMMCLMAKEGG